MPAFFLYGVAALACGWQLAQQMLWGVWGKPFNPIEGVGFLGSVVLLSAAYVSLFSVRRSLWTAAIGFAALWTFYLPAVVQTFSDPASHSVSELASALAPCAVLLCATAYWATQTIRLLKRKSQASALTGVPPRNFRRAVLLLSALAVLTVVGKTTLGIVQSHRTPCRYEIPEGFVGWILIEFDRSDAAPLPMQDGKRVFRIGSDGRLKTSSKSEDGWAKDEFFYVGKGRVELSETAWGKGGLIWGQSNGTMQVTGQKPCIYENFFVGSEEAFKSAASSQPQPE